MSNPTYSSFDSIYARCKRWGQRTNILATVESPAQGTPLGQAEKTVEEARELFDSVLIGDRAETVDAIGDILVTLVMQCELQGIDMLACFDIAVGIIEQRKGRMIDGKFVKEVV